jgi:hypothetical protein
MKRLTFLLYILLCGLLTTACTDADEAAEEAYATLTLTLSSGGLSTRADAKAVDPEYYVGTVDLLLYAGTDRTAEPVYTQQLTMSSSTYRTYSLGMSYNVVNKLFAESDSCTIYVVANLADRVKALSSLTLEKVQGLVLTSDFPNISGKLDSYAMDGLGVVTLNRTKMTMQSSLALERAVAKILLEIEVADRLEQEDGAIYYSVHDDGAIRADLRNGATSGYLRGEMAAADRGLTGSKYHYSKTYYQETATTAADDEAEEEETEADETTYTKLTHTPFYSYPNTWTSSYVDNETAIELCVPWRRESADKTEVETTYFYYSIPINYEGKKIERNHYYKIHLKVGMLGSIVASEPQEVENMDYEILDWIQSSADGEEDGSTDSDNNTSSSTSVSAELTQSHYLVVEDTKFTLYDEDELDFTYNTCSTLEKAYVKSISYTPFGSTSATKIYSATYSSSSGVSGSYSTSGTLVTNLTSTLSVTDEPDMTASGESTGSGTIVFKCDAKTTAGAVYSPITFVLGLVNESSHGGEEQVVTIVQYPSKYIETAAGGNVFVNGYYGLVSSKSSSNFVYNGYSSTSGNTAYTGCYNSSTSTTQVDWFGNQPTSSSGFVNAGYEYVRTSLGTSSLSYPNTVNVHISAFAADDYTFSVESRSGWNNDYAAEEREYIIGDPRVAGGYTSDTEHSTKAYNYLGSYLYDYYVSNSGNNRYVSSWGDKAAKIKIGGADVSYENVIAPYYKIQSSYGAAYGSCYFEVAQKRCATYQEAGYPAGRWRLPTLAEVAFIYRLQIEGVITEMFDMSVPYWSASGSDFFYQDNKIRVRTKYKDWVRTGTDTRPTTSCVRCVYDLWYWGTEAGTTTTYNPNP